MGKKLSKPGEQGAEGSNSSSVIQSKSPADFKTNSPAPTGDYSDYSSKLTVEDFDLLKVCFYFVIVEI